MSSFEKKCLNCGVTYIEGDNYCRNCSAPLEHEPFNEEAMLEGIKKSDWHLFIDKNSSRYVEIFSKNEGKKIFFHMNWAAMFFNFYWMFYRKMYKYAFVFLAVSMIFSIALTALVTTALKPAVLDARKIIEPYSEYYNETGNVYPEYYESSMDVSKALEASNQYNKEINSLTTILEFWIIIPSLLFGVLFGLLADCIYRSYILRNIEYKVGGTSGWSMVGGIAVYQLIIRIIESSIILFITAKLLE